MIERILLPTDFSHVSMKVVNCVKDLKDVGVREVVLLHVLDLNKILSPASGIDLPAVIESYEKESMEKLKEIGKKLEESGFNVEIVEILEGDPVFKIIDVAEEKNVDMIVIGSHGKGLIKELLLGSVSEGVVRRSNKPVLVVKFDIIDDAVIKVFDYLPRKILYAFDFSEESRKLKDLIKEFAKAGEEVLIVHVVEKDEELTDKEIEELESMKKEFEEMGKKAEIFIEGGVPYKEIIKVMEEYGATMIALASRGKGSIREMLGGTVSNVVRRAIVPVLVYK